MKDQKREQPKREQPKVVESFPTSCRACGSTERTAYHDTTEHAISGDHPTFGEYSHVVFRRTECKSCGQCRVDKAYELRRGDRVENE
jgi:hypothetical protein